ncbi:MAG: RNA polymerase sigma factor [bacterium]
MIQNGVSHQIDKILEGAKNLDHDALSKLCSYYYPKIFRYVLSRVKTREDAEDITSEVFVRMVKSLDKQNGNFQAWLLRIASNLIIDHFRRATTKNKALLEETQRTSVNKKQSDIEKRFLHNNLRELLNKLTPDQQRVLSLKFFEGFNNEEIADILDKSVGAVKALQFRGLTTLKKFLEKQE